MEGCFVPGADVTQQIHLGQAIYCRIRGNYLPYNRGLNGGE